MPDLDDKYWLLLDDHLALLALFFKGNLLFTVKDVPTLSSIFITIVLSR